ncbi:hypothetical protein NQ318_021113, partial [Aromia moschata]
MFNYAAELCPTVIVLKMRLRTRLIRTRLARLLYRNFRGCYVLYEVCKLSNATGNVAPDLATLRRRDLEGRFFGGLRHSQSKESRLQMNHAGEGLNLQEPIIMSTEYGI